MALSLINTEIEKYQKAIEYNDYLIDNDIDYTLEEYLNDANEKFYKYDISFMKEFMDLVNRVDFCIHHEYLIKYGIVDVKKKDSGKILQNLKARNLNEGEDYLVTKVSDLRKQGGTSTKNVYMLTPDAYKKCLMGSANTKIFANYFLLLEKIIKYYNLYQLKLNKLERVKLSKKLDEVLVELKKSNNKLDTLSIENNKQTEELKEIKDILHSSSHDRVADIEAQEKKSDFVLLRNNSDYYTLRAQKYETNRKIKEKGLPIVLRLPNCPNSIQFNNKLKETLKHKAIFSRNNITLINDYSEEQLVKDIKKVYEERIIDL